MCLRSSRCRLPQDPPGAEYFSPCAHRIAAAGLPKRSDGKSIAARQENDIGQEHALFYEAHATYLELRGSYAKATAAFEAGIQRSDASVVCSCPDCMPHEPLRTTCLQQLFRSCCVPCARVFEALE